MNFFASCMVALLLGLGTIVLVDSVGHQSAQASCDPPPADPPKQPPKK